MSIFREDFVPYRGFFTVRLWGLSQDRESYGETVRIDRFAFFFSNTIVFAILLW